MEAFSLLEKVDFRPPASTPRAAVPSYMASHNCSVLQAGTATIYEDSTFSGRAMCVRRPGDSSCFWIPSPAVQKPERSVPARRR